MVGMQLETPSRILRRIEDLEGREMPSLPSMSLDDVSEEMEDLSSDVLQPSDSEGALSMLGSPVHSTPAASSHHTMASTIHPASSTSSTARFAASLASRSTKSAGLASSRGNNTSKKSHYDSFDISMIPPSLPDIHRSYRSGDSDEDDSIGSVPDEHLPPPGEEDVEGEDEDFSISDALQSISRSGSPHQLPLDALENDGTPKKTYDYSVSLKSEPKASPFDKYRNIAFRRTINRMRTPSLSRTSSSPATSPANSTPHSNRSIALPRSNAASPISFPLPRSTNASPAAIPLPRSATASPAVAPQRSLRNRASPDYEPEPANITQETDARSMDITDVHYSPPRQDDQATDEGTESEQEPLGEGYGGLEGPSEDEHKRGSFEGGTPSFYTDRPYENSVPGDQQDSTHDSDDGMVSYEPDARAGSSAEMAQTATDEPSADGTFSTDDGPTPFAQRRASPYNTSRKGSPNASSVAENSTALTPTPAYPRPRARFNIPSIPEDLPVTPAPQEELEEHSTAPGDDLVTPHSRRRSFLLSVINSTARPRFKVPTPHPRNVYSTPSVVDITPVPAQVSVVKSNIHTAFAGVTPRPRLPVNRRLSHPLSQAIAPSPGTSDSESAGAHAQRTESAPHSPYDGTVDKASFISTGSSHDLTTHHRVNTSFDPAMGFGAGGQGVGRFDAIKLNNYLHGLNRKLEEENQALAERLRKYETVEEHERSVEEVQAADRRLSGVNRRLSGGTALGNVQEEEWREEKAHLEDIVESLHEDVARCMAEKEKIERELENEKKQRSHDKEMFQYRVAESEGSANKVLADQEEEFRQRLNEIKRDFIALEAEKNAALERSDNAEEALKQKTQEMKRDLTALEAEKAAALQDADKAEEALKQQIKEMKRDLTALESEKAAALERADNAEEALASTRELGGDLKAAQNKISKLERELRDANSEVKELEEEIDHRINETEHELRNKNSVIADLEAKLKDNADMLAKERDNARDLQNNVNRLEHELEDARADIEELERNGESDAEQIEHLKQVLEQKESEASQADQLAFSLAEAQKRTEELKKQLKSADELRLELEEALTAAEEKMAEDANAIAELQVQVSSAERERDRALERSISKSLSHNPLEDAPTAEELDALEQELDDARRENARLQVLLDQSPARKAIDKAKDFKIEMLQKEKEELLERNKALRMTTVDINTPSKLNNISGISPFHRHVLAMSIHAPKTPGGPLRELSWLQNTTIDPTTQPYVDEIHRLERELEIANESIDDKVDKLADAGATRIELMQKLDEAHRKTISLEEEIAQLRRKDERRLRYLERARCQKCNVKVGSHLLSEDSSLMSTQTLPSEPPTPPTKTSEALRAEVASVNNRLKLLQMEWEDEKRQLLGEKARLQDKTNQLHTEVKQAKDEARKIIESERVNERVKSTVQNELERAKATISELEADLKAERSRLRVLTIDQERVLREKEEVFKQVQRNESDMEDVRQQLTRLKQNNKNLEKELRENANAEQKARLLETRVSENLDTIEQLRQERSLLVSEHKQLQQKYLEAAESANKLQDELAMHSTSHDNHRHQLDLRLLELEDLRRALNDRTDELERVEAEKNRVSAEKNDVAKMIAGLEADLRRVRKDAEVFGRDLKLLRAEKEKLEIQHQEEIDRAERSKKQSQAQIRVLNEQLEIQKQKTVKARGEIENHVCAADEQQISAMRVKHNKECKGLIVQIRYLKAKFIRESAFRSDLGYQKQYLLVLLSQFEKSERNIIASIARIGYPVLPTPAVKKPPMKLKSVVQLVVFVRRIRQASDAWREQSASKQAIASALDEVRRRRESARV